MRFKLAIPIKEVVGRRFECTRSLSTSSSSLLSKRPSTPTAPTKKPKISFKHKDTTYGYDNKTSEYVCTLNLYNSFRTKKGGITYSQGIEVNGRGKSRAAAKDQATENSEGVIEELQEKGSA
ncbi:hypothetical protein JCM3765_003849 [Sporobolomyces pararoseus]